MQSFYELLGLAVDDPPAKVQARYRLLVRRFHPDAGGTSEEFRQYTEAYRTLADPEGRALYNRQIGIYARPRSLHSGHDLYERVQVSQKLSQPGGHVQLVFDRYEPCPRCWLQGCERCQGQGQSLEQVTVEVRIPANCQHGKAVFIEGGGACREPGGPRGDLYVYVDILRSG
jgi:DnaJ-class molecular chaperone